MKLYNESIANIFILCIILAIGTYAIITLAGNQFAQLIVGVVVAISYAVWGVLHHWIIGEFHKKVVIEYVLIGAIAVIMLLIILEK